MVYIYTPYNGALYQQTRSTPEIQVQLYYSPISRLHIIKKTQKNPKTNNQKTKTKTKTETKKTKKKTHPLQKKQQKTKPNTLRSFKFLDNIVIIPFTPLNIYFTYIKVKTIFVSLLF